MGVRAEFSYTCDSWNTWMALDLLLLLELETVMENGSKIDSNCLPKIVLENAESLCHSVFTHSVHHCLLNSFLQL